MTSKDNVTILAIGPMHIIADALKLEPRIAKRANFVSMASIYKGYGNSNTLKAEFNIASAVEEENRLQSKVVNVIQRTS